MQSGQSWAQDLRSSLPTSLGELRDLAHQVMLPLDVSSPLTSPNSFPAQVSTRVFTQSVTLKTATLGSEATLLLTPDLLMPAFVSFATPVNFPVAHGPMDIKARYDFDQPNNAVLAGSGAKLISLVDGTAVAPISPVTDGAGTVKLGFSVVKDTQVGNNIFVTIVNKRKSSQSSATYQVWYKISSTNHWQLNQTTPPVAWGASYQNQIGYNSNDIDAVAVHGTNSTQYDVEWHFSDTQVISDSGQVLRPALEKQVIADDITNARVTAMAVLVTNVTPVLNRGGNVSIGRVPNDFAPFGADVQSRMAKLPKNRRHIGDAAVGGYTWWLPSTYDEFELDNYANLEEAYRNSEYLLCKLSGLSDDAVFIVTVSTIVEFYSPNIIFEKRLTPIFSSEIHNLFHILSMMPAASCNPSHAEMFKDLVTRGVELGKRAYQHYQDNSALYNSIGKLLLGAVAAL